MTIEELSFVTGHPLEAWFPDVDGNWMFHFKESYVCDGIVLVGVVGRGKTMEAARANYLDRIRGQEIVFSLGMDPSKPSIRIPKDLK